ncbi:MAG: hypothetical protein IJV07_05585 [Alphaproteobacteria bacterium]|nr:hypothetical protein [Alphaproteobacteria bacterium]
MFSSYKRVFWLAALMTLFVYVPFSVFWSTDVWARMSRIMEWANAGFPWREQVVFGQNYPFGFEMHWTRPLDIIGYAFAWPFIPNWGLKRALEIMSYFVPVLVMLVAVRGFFFACRGYLTPKMAFGAFWLFLCGIGYSWGQASVGYFDHHCFHFMLLVWSIGLVARGLLVKRNNGYFIAAGVLSALGTWITPEFFINIYLLMVPMAFGWLWHNRSLKPALLYTGAYTIVLLGAMTFDHPMAGFWTLDFARPSLFHVLLGVFNLILMGGLSYSGVRRNRVCRLIYGLLGVMILGCVLLFGFHSVLLVPMVDPFMYYLWTSKVSEMRPLSENWIELLTLAILPLMLAPCLCIWSLVRWGKNRMAPFMLMVSVGTLFYATIMIFHIRAGISQNAFFCFLGAGYLNLTFAPREKSFMRSLIFLAFYLVFVGAMIKGVTILRHFQSWGARYYLNQYRENKDIDIPEFLRESFDKIIQNEKEEEQPNQNTVKNKNNENNTAKGYACSLSEKVLEKMKGTFADGAVFSDLFSAPQINWETGRPGLGGPYDRNVDGITDSAVIALDRPPFTTAKELLKKHQVSTVLLQNPDCLGFLFKNPKTKKNYDGLENSFHYSVYYETKDMSDWLQLDYVDPKTNVKIFKVIDPPIKKKKGRSK